MCGIAGILLAPSGPRGQLASAIPMTAALRHRGPDGSGLWSDERSGIALGHRRLAIVDLTEAGRQPMHAHGGSLVVTYNGEIYGPAALRSDLERRGHQFRGHSDTEVMLAAFETYGIEPALRRMPGMFALALWDRSTETLHLIRDRLGKKPLHVACANGALLFASELKAFQHFPGFEHRVNARALGAMLRQGWVPDDECIWERVFKLPPGAILSIRACDLERDSFEAICSRTRQWWSLAEAAGPHPVATDDTSALTELDTLLRTVVQERMVADVPMGALLSGGVDSSLVVSLMQAQSATAVRTFTAGFDAEGYDEAAAARSVARHLGTDHTEFQLTAEVARETIPELPLIWDEPFADESQIPTLLVCRLARQYVTVALTGDGGDEGFGGYSRHFMSARLAHLFGLPLPVRRAGSAALGLLSRESWSAAQRSLGFPGFNAGQWQKLRRVLGAADEHEFYARCVEVGGGGGERGPAPDGFGAVPDLPDLPSRLMFRDMARYLPGDILVKLDRASMAVSLEARCPLLDHRVIEFAWRLPVAMKIRGGKGKWLLRQALRQYLPDSLIDRPKHGFDVPIGAWLRGPLRDWAHALLDGNRLRQQGLLDPARVQACWHEHLSGRADRAGELWAILMVQAWLDAQRVRASPQPDFAELELLGNGVSRP